MQECLYSRNNIEREKNIEFTNNLIDVLKRLNERTIAQI